MPFYILPTNKQKNYEMADKSVHIRKIWGGKKGVRKRPYHQVYENIEQKH